MKEKFANYNQKLFLLLLFAILSTCASQAGETGIAYKVNWPVIHLDGTFTLNVGPAFGTYRSTAAVGRYGGLNDAYNVVWTDVRFECTSNFAQLFFFWGGSYTGYACSPSYVGRSEPWTSADQAWQDLIAQGKVDGVYITINDTTPPQILNIAATPNKLWPPDHRMVPVTLIANAVDDYDPSPVSRIIEVRSNEPQGSFAPDWEITGPLTVNLRAERLGSARGRTYTIVVECKDASGNASTGFVEVEVPRDRK
jgi:hypothetical protein